MDQKILEHVTRKNHNKSKATLRLGKKNSLTLLTTLTATFGFIVLCVSVSTDNWLTTFERDKRQNGSCIIAIKSGLWRKCEAAYFIMGVDEKTVWDINLKTVPSSPPPNCSKIAYFSGKPKGLAEVKPPVAILYDIQPAAFFPTTGLMGLLGGCILSFLSNCDHKVKKLIFIGGGLFVLSGIFLLVGIVLYVGSISQAFDGTLGNAESENKYAYDYGTSFYFSVIAFIMTEFSGIFAIYLYIAKHRHYLRVKREKFMTRSHSINSCVGLVPSNSHFSLEGGTVPSLGRKMISNSNTGVRAISTSSSADLVDNALHTNSSQQWLLSNSYSKATMSSELNNTNNQSHEKLVSTTHLFSTTQPLPSLNGPSTLPIISGLNTKPNTKIIKNISSNNTLPPNCIQFYDDEEIGETSFGYNPRQQPLSNNSLTDINNTNRAFYDNTSTISNTASQPTAFYVDPRQQYIISPDHSIISNALSPGHHHNNKIKSSANIESVIHSPLGNLKNIHILTSIDDDDCMSSSNNDQCNCAQYNSTNNQNPNHQNINEANLNSNKELITLSNTNNLSIVSSPIPNNYIIPPIQYSSSSSQLQLSFPTIKNPTTPNMGSSRKITSV